MSIVAEHKTIEEKILSGITTDGSNPELDAFRLKARESFLKTGFPGVKNEEYRYLALDRIFKNELKEIAAAEPGTFTTEILARFPFLKSSCVIVSVNGYVVKEQPGLATLPAGVDMFSIKELLKKNSGKTNLYFPGKHPGARDPFSDLNAALFRDGFFLRIPPNQTIETPIVLISLNNSLKAQMVNQRNLIVHGKGSSARIMEMVIGTETSSVSFVNPSTEIILEDGARAEHFRLQQDGIRSYQVNTCRVYQSKNTAYTNFTFTLGGKLVRNNLQIALQDTGSEAHLFGLFVPRLDETVDNHTRVDHAMPHCNSNELYKGIITDKATGVFNGKIVVSHGAQKTNAYQSSKNILLSEDASIYAKPQLEIYADDVKCSHGTSTGKLNEEALFYLRSRGIGKDRAKKLLLNAFSGEVTGQVTWDAFREYIENTVAERLSV